MKKRSTQTKISSAFLLTLNQPEKFNLLRDYLLSLNTLGYAVAGEERAPTTGHRHIHIFAQFKHSTRLSLNRLNGAHVDKCKGTPQQNKAYVEKGKKIWEFGKMKTKGWLSIENVKQMSSTERFSLPIQYYRIVKDMNLIDENKLHVKDVRKHIKVYYISGRSGIGKTNFAFYLIGDKEFNIVKYENNFWLGVTNNCKIALYDDWRDNHMRASEFINFIDYNKHIMNIKNGSVINNYEIIIITSILELKNIYENVEYESKLQWERRIHEIRLIEYVNKERENRITYLFCSLIKYIKKYIFKMKFQNIS